MEALVLMYVHYLILRVLLSFTNSKFQVRKRVLCDHCRGSGAASDSDIHTCTGCNGHGVKLVKQQVCSSMLSNRRPAADMFLFSGVSRNVCPNPGVMR